MDYDEEMYVEYNGKTVDLSCDYFRFGGPGYGFFNEYSVCVTPLYFNDSECAVKLNIKTSLFESTKHVGIYCLSNVYLRLFAPIFFLAFTCNGSNNFPYKPII